MARFSDLPGELILGFIPFVLPEDLENFAQSCQRCHSLAKSTLEKHRLLIRKYATLKNEGTRTISKILKEVLVNPRIGRYIRNVSLKCVGGTKTNFNPRYSEEDLELFVAASTGGKFPPTSGQTSLARCRGLIERGNEDILLAILLPLLPNLNSLSFPRVFNNGDCCWTSHMFSYIPNLSTPTLTKLSTIRVNIGAIYFHLDEVKAYANLPSVKSLSASRLSCVEYDVPVLSTPSSNLTSLELWDCRVPAVPLHDFLFGFNCLQSFAYSCDLPERSAHQFNASVIRSALLAKAKNTLRKLTILGCDRHSPVMGTLRPFEVLEEVCTDWGILLLSDLHRYRPRLQLAASLPNSLRKLSLNDEVGRGNMHHRELVDCAVRAQKRGTHAQLQPHENLAQFEGGLQLQELTITFQPRPFPRSFERAEPQKFYDSDRWYWDCEKVGIALNHYVKRKKEKPEQTT